MAHELPMDLIRQVKTVTRAEAGLSDYDPTGYIPPLPSLSEAVAAFDHSPPYLRCKNCKGKLLRGVQSVLCIYCGRQNDVPPDPISFKDTLAYRWLLESLHLDGSEMVGLSTKKSEFDRGQSAPKGQIPLSDFLDLKLTWPTESEKEEILLNKKTQERSSLNFTGFDLDNFFSGSHMLDAPDRREKHSSGHNHVEATEGKESVTYNNLSFFENELPSELAVHSSESKDGVETAEAKEVTTRNDLSFFQNVKPVELAAQTSKDEDGDAFSGWEATFQSAHTGDLLDSSQKFEPSISSAVSDQHDSSKSLDPFGGSTVDLSSQLDSVFGTGEDLKHGKAQVGSAALSSIGDWNEDLWKNLSSNVSQETSQPDSSVGVKNVVPQDPQDFDWFGIDQEQSNNVNAPSGSTTCRDDDSFIDWNDFTSSSVNVSSENSATQIHNQPIAASVETSDLNFFSTDNTTEEVGFYSFSQADPIPSSSSMENPSAAMTDFGLEVSAPDRAVDTCSDVSLGPEPPARDGDVKTAGAQQREEVERILSQMHDLSFMLENNLSLPSKSNSLHS